MRIAGVITSTCDEGDYYIYIPKNCSCRRCERCCKHCVEIDHVKHGYWEHDETGANFCSVCDKYPYDDGEYHLIWHTDYCPHCGAKMEELFLDVENDG